MTLLLAVPVHPWLEAGGRHSPNSQPAGTPTIRLSSLTHRAATTLRTAATQRSHNAAELYERATSGDLSKRPPARNGNGPPRVAFPQQLGPGFK
jgi:hypothetical protein